MSLLTPPPWSQINEYHSTTSPIRAKKLAASASKELPVRSILKQSSFLILPLMCSENDRQVTPEPSDPLSDLHYIEGPVNKILAECSTLADLIQAYSVLTARLRAAVHESTDSGCSWPLFQPLRKRRTSFVNAVVRDLGRALVDPMEGCDQLDCSTPEPSSSLPSPEKSPRKKRCGMNEEQVKYARDLATVTHAVIKLLGLAFTLPAVYGLFDDQDLGSMVTQVLAIPLATDLPTPNARKTCALAIWLLQTQRLPRDVLAPAKDRITYALRRAVEGELGKEGKKGSVSDGLKAIHELSVHEPSVFVPAFTELLPSILDNLLAPRLALRTQACHALGGLALGASQIPLSYTHTRLSDIVAAALTVDPAPPSSTSSPRTPGGSRSNSMLIKTLRTTLNAQDPSCAAQGPVWALCTLAALVVLLGPMLATNANLINGLKGLLALSVRHKKSSAVGWTQAEEARRDEFWKVVATMLDMGAGVGTVGALLAHRTDNPRMVSRVITVLEAMVQRGGNMCHDAVQTLCRLVSATSDASSRSPSAGEEQEEEEWDWAKLLPTGLFSADPGLLTVDFGSLSEEVRPLLKQTPGVADVRVLTPTELWMPGVMDGLIKVWRTALTQVCLSSDAELPPELVQSWNGLLGAAFRGLQGSTDDGEVEEDQEDDSVQKLAELAVSVIQDILRDSNVQLVPSADTPTPSQTGSDVDLVPHTRSNAAMKLCVVRSLWTQTHSVLPAQALAGSASEALLTWLMEKEAELVWETNTPHDARTQWAMLCADVLARSSTGARDASASLLRVFWGVRGASRRWTWSWAMDVRALVWRTFVERWRALAKGWEDALMLLGVPFADKDAWEMSTQDLDAWDATLQFCLWRVLDEGTEAARVVDHLAGTIASTHIPTGYSATRAADLLLSHLEMPSDAPALLEFVNDTMVSTYPPEPRNKVASMWLMRTVTKVVDTCPATVLRDVLGTLQEGLSSLGPSIESLKYLGPFLESGFTGREDKPQDIVEAFQDYWDLTYGEVPTPEGGWPSPVATCLKACGRETITKPLLPPSDIVQVTIAEKAPLSTPELAFSWSSSSTIAVDVDEGDNASDRPSKVTSIKRGHILDFIMGSTPPSTPPRLSRSPLRSPKRVPNGSDKENTPPKPPVLPSLLERIVMAASPGTVHLGKRRASNTLSDSRPSKRSRGHVIGKPDEKEDDDDHGVTPSDDSEAEREEVQQSLLRPITPSPTGHHPAALATFNTTPRAPPPPLDRSSSPTPQRVLRKRKRKGVFMDAVEVDMPTKTQSVRKNNRRRRNSHTSKPCSPSPSPSVSLAPPSSLSLSSPSERREAGVPSAPLSSPMPHGPPALRRSLRRAKSLVMMNMPAVPERVLVTPAQRKRQKMLVKKTASGVGVSSLPSSSSLLLSSHAIRIADSSSPISASLKRARVLVGSDDSMFTTEIDGNGGGGGGGGGSGGVGDKFPPSESSDDDPHFGQVTPYHIFSPVPRRMSSRFFTVQGSE
ncbi:hypothetical protein B0F90DRAFT_1817185 [Multifurca ochricompacta]|uniref:Telomere-associated protein Rif1 N-terminal domain-containing protein n=1 Tax=Multifurca ochricompacta TaxID=376703 RepID=A0AAD4M4S1_9AGAM|nr:hypothetical protein B0F90DRAFT_1817185 [Multifurca ochricompacta]